MIDLNLFLSVNTVLLLLFLQFVMDTFLKVQISFKFHMFYIVYTILYMMLNKRQLNQIKKIIIILQYKYDFLRNHQ